MFSLKPPQPGQKPGKTFAKHHTTLTTQKVFYDSNTMCIYSAGRKIYGVIPQDYMCMLPANRNKGIQQKCCVR